MWNIMVLLLILHDFALTLTSACPEFLTPWLNSLINFKCLAKFSCIALHRVTSTVGNQTLAFDLTLTRDLDLEIQFKAGFKMFSSRELSIAVSRASRYTYWFGS